MEVVVSERDENSFIVFCTVHIGEVCEPGVIALPEIKIARLHGKLQRIQVAIGLNDGQGARQGAATGELPEKRSIGIGRHGCY